MLINDLACECPYRSTLFNDWRPPGKEHINHCRSRKHPPQHRHKATRKVAFKIIAVR